MTPKNLKHMAILALALVLALASELALATEKSWFVQKGKNGFCTVYQLKAKTDKTIAGPFPTKELAQEAQVKMCTAINQFQLLTYKADKGDPEAQYQLGLLYRDGRGVQKDLRKAGGLFLKAAERGHRAARQELESAGVKME